MVKSVVARIGIVIVVAALVVVGRGFFFYEGFYHPPPAEMPGYKQIAVSTAPSKEFSDNYTQGKGIVLVDLAHANDFEKEELNTLFLRLVSRGLTIKFLGVRDDLKKELLGESGEKNVGGVKPAEASDNATEEKPMPADAFIVVSPQSDFSQEDLETVDKFVTGGGKLLLIADPTRNGPKINSLAIKFGLMFESDYLYNMKENEINYRNIFIIDFADNSVTKKLEKIALYTAGSISSAGGGIAFTDENTFSSLIESRKRLSPIASSTDTRVLALYDLTFMTEPYNGILDNNQLIANIADWLIPTAKGVASK